MMVSYTFVVSLSRSYGGRVWILSNSATRSPFVKGEVFRVLAYLIPMFWSHRSTWDQIIYLSLIQRIEFSCLIYHFPLFIALFISSVILAMDVTILRYLKTLRRLNTSSATFSSLTISSPTSNICCYPYFLLASISRYYTSFHIGKGCSYNQLQIVILIKNNNIL